MKSNYVQDSRRIYVGASVEFLTRLHSDLRAKSLWKFFNCKLHLCLCACGSRTIPPSWPEDRLLEPPLADFNWIWRKTLRTPQEEDYVRREFGLINTRLNLNRVRIKRTICPVNSTVLPSHVLCTCFCIFRRLKMFLFSFVLIENRLNEPCVMGNLPILIGP